MISVTIDGKQVFCEEGESILNVARANNIFIPAICYLNKCSATLACRLCLVDADGKQAFSCNAKVKDGMVIVTKNEEIDTERKAIMQAYDINHPLECGVCDKSGSCELQNYTLEAKVDCQEYAIADTHKPVQNWGVIKYDPSLCIVCERCVTACGELIGDKAIGTVARGGNELDKSYKETMPKNAFTIWQKFNKNLIGIKSGAKELDCTLCGECVAVCPVGAMTSAHFTYKSNAWELNKVPAACGHCASACHIYYETKHHSINNSSKTIYRVTNEWNFQSLCGAGRYAFDYENFGVKSKELFDRAQNALLSADTIVFNANITNEEALMLQTLKSKFGKKLYSKTTLNFKNFLNNYSYISISSLYTADTNTVRKSNFIISLGTHLKSDAPNVRFAVNNALANKGAFVYFHPVEDSVISGMSKNVLQLNHNVNSEEAVLMLILKLFADFEKLPQTIKDKIASFDYSFTKTVVEKIKKKIQELVTETTTNEDGSSEEVQKTVEKEIEEEVEKEITIQSTKLLDILGIELDSLDKISALLAKKDSFCLIVGKDLYAHQNSAKLAKLIGLVDKTTNFDVLILPPETNSLGVSLICDLDNQVTGKTVGYNENGDFIFSSIKGYGDIAIPAFNQQEGTVVNLDKRVVPTNAALKFDGYELNDFMMSEQKLYAVEWTKELGEIEGFSSVDFDDLPNNFENDGFENRGYLLSAISVKEHDLEFDDVKPAEIQDAIYCTNHVNSFNGYTTKSEILKQDKEMFVCSSEFAQKHMLETGHTIKMLDRELEVQVSAKTNSKTAVAYLLNCKMEHGFISMQTAKGN